MTVESTATAVVVKSGRCWFARMVVIAHYQQMNMQEVLTYTLGPLPWYLATAVGAPTNTAKSALLHMLEGKAQPVEDVPASAVWILDGVAMLHSMKYFPRTFSSLASYVFPLVKSAASQDRTNTDLIMDQYPDVSIKVPERERERRGAGGSIQITINHGNHKCLTQWKKYLSHGSNKANIAYFLVQEWQKPEYFVRFAYFGSLFVTHGMEWMNNCVHNTIDPLHDDVTHQNNPRRALHCGRFPVLLAVC